MRFVAQSGEMRGTLVLFSYMGQRVADSLTFNGLDGDLYLTLLSRHAGAERVPRPAVPDTAHR